MTDAITVAENRVAKNIRTNNQITNLALYFKVIRNRKPIRKAVRTQMSMTSQLLDRSRDICVRFLSSRPWAT